MKKVREQQQQQGMYRPEFEHDNCGIGACLLYTSRIAAEKLIDLIENPKTTLIDRFTVDGTLFKGASVRRLLP